MHSVNLVFVVHLLDSMWGTADQGVCQQKHATRELHPFPPAGFLNNHKREEARRAEDRVLREIPIAQGMG